MGVVHLLGEDCLIPEDADLVGHFGFLFRELLQGKGFITGIDRPPDGADTSHRDLVYDLVPLEDPVNHCPSDLKCPEKLWQGGAGGATQFNPLPVILGLN